MWLALFDIKLGYGLWSGNKAMVEGNSRGMYLKCYRSVRRRKFCWKFCYEDNILSDNYQIHGLIQKLQAAAFHTCIGNSTRFLRSTSADSIVISAISTLNGAASLLIARSAEWGSLFANELRKAVDEAARLASAR